MAVADSLLDRARAGDTEALASLLAEHGPAVARKLEIGRQWRSLIEPDDVMQVTYMEAFLQIHRFDPARGAGFEHWLLQIARNNLLDAVRALSRRKQPQPRQRVAVAVGESSMELLNFLGVTTTTPSREAGRAEIARVVEEAVNRLPADYARVIRLYDLEGKSIDDVVEAMKRSQGAVHMLRARAHDALRERLGAESGFFSHSA